jgi:hypothetical protein
MHMLCSLERLRIRTHNNSKMATRKEVGDRLYRRVDWRVCLAKWEWAVRFMAVVLVGAGIRLTILLLLV